MIKKLLMGNEAIALGLALQNSQVVTAYPGTPSSEILPSFKRWSELFFMNAYVNWSINEKVAFETAYTASISGIRSATMMKQVGLNVASDSLMSASYMGVKGGFIIISADDPGPHSSQTEQDSRMMAMIAKVPVLDPSSPTMAIKMVEMAYTLSESFEIPVMIRPTTRVCHSSQDIAFTPFQSISSHHRVSFHKDTTRWASTPRFRLLQHINLNNKIKEIALQDRTYPLLLNEGRGLTIISSGVVTSYLLDLITSCKEYQDITLYQVLQPYPLHQRFINQIIAKDDKILVIEETSPVIEMQIARSDITSGKLNDLVPSAGELLPENIENILRRFKAIEPKVFATAKAPPSRRPSLCAGCPHRASFFAIKKAFPSAKSIYTSDIGCYTLGINLKAVDTFICMGGAISQASGFYHVFKFKDDSLSSPFIVATIGDSTFFHAGIPPLIDAVTSGARFLLVILDNSTTAMTGNQPTVASFKDSKGKPLVSIEKIVKACGVVSCKTANPYEFDSFLSVLKTAGKKAKSGVAVVIAKAPCLMDRTQKLNRKSIKVVINDRCDGCGYCIREFECPAIVHGDKKTSIDYHLCTNCGICVYVCPKKAILSEPTS